jgi:hypothetical protein
MSLVVDLPKDVSLTLLRNWLSLRDIARLDTSLTSNTLRLHWLEIIENEIITCSTVNIRDRDLAKLKWLMKKNAYCNKIAFRNCRIRETVIPDDFIMKWLCQSMHLKTLRFKEKTNISFHLLLQFLLIPFLQKQDEQDEVFQQEQFLLRKGKLQQSLSFSEQRSLMLEAPFMSNNNDEDSLNTSFLQTSSPINMKGNGLSLSNRKRSRSSDKILQENESRQQDSSQNPFETGLSPIRNIPETAVNPANISHPLTAMEVIERMIQRTLFNLKEQNRLMKQSRFPSLQGVPSPNIHPYQAVASPLKKRKSEETPLPTTTVTTTSSSSSHLLNPSSRKKIIKTKEGEASNDNNDFNDIEGEVNNSISNSLLLPLSTSNVELNNKINSLTDAVSLPQQSLPQQQASSQENLNNNNNPSANNNNDQHSSANESNEDEQEELNDLMMDNTFTTTNSSTSFLYPSNSSFPFLSTIHPKLKMEKIFCHIEELHFHFHDISLLTSFFLQLLLPKVHKLKFFTIIDCLKVNDNDLTTLVHSCPLIEEITIDNCSMISGMFFPLLLTKSVHLNKLSMKHCQVVSKNSTNPPPNITELFPLPDLYNYHHNNSFSNSQSGSSIGPISLSRQSSANSLSLSNNNNNNNNNNGGIPLPNFQSKVVCVDFTHTRDIGDYLLPYLCYYCPNIERINLSFCHLTSNHFQYLSSYCLKLKVLFLPGNTIDDEIIIPLVNNCRLLESFVIGFSPRVTENACFAIANNLKLLKTFALWGNHKALNEKSMEKLAEGCPLLEKVAWTYTGITDNVLNILVTKCLLTRIEINGCQLLTDKCIEIISQCCSSRLTHFVAENVSFTDMGCAFLANCSVLEYVNLSNSKSITSKGIAQIIQKCPKLEILKIKECYLITDDLLYLIADYSKCLKELDISYIKQLSFQSILNLLDKCVSLHKLFMINCFDQQFIQPMEIPFFPLHPLGGGGMGMGMNQNNNPLPFPPQPPMQPMMNPPVGFVPLPPFVPGGMPATALPPNFPFPLPSAHPYHPHHYLSSAQQQMGATFPPLPPQQLPGFLQDPFLNLGNLPPSAVSLTINDNNSLAPEQPQANNNDEEDEGNNNELHGEEVDQDESAGIIDLSNIEVEGEEEGANNINNANEDNGMNLFLQEEIIIDNNNNNNTNLNNNTNNNLFNTISDAQTMLHEILQLGSKKRIHIIH